MCSISVCSDRYRLRSTRTVARVGRGRYGDRQVGGRQLKLYDVDLNEKATSVSATVRILDIDITNPFFPGRPPAGLNSARKYDSLIPI